MTKLRLAVLMAGSLAISAAPVSAGVTGWSWSWLNQCGGNLFTTCMSGSISYSGSGNTLLVTVRNDAPYAGDVFTAVGLFNMPAGQSPTITTSLSNWTDKNYNGINGALNDPSYAISTKNGSNGAITEDGLYHSFSFTFSTLTSAQLYNLRNVVGVGVHAQRGPNGCSAKVGVVNPNGDGTGEALNNFDAAGAARENCVSVPEPESYALLATGIAGLLFVAARRRTGLELVDEHGHAI